MSYRIAIFAQGSRGDVQPYVALAQRLVERGHKVTLAAPDDFEGWIKAKGLTFAAMGTNMRDLLASPDVRKTLAGNPLGMRKLWKSVAVPMLEASLKTLWDVGQNADILIHHPKVVGAADVAEVTGAPVVVASPVPIIPTGDFPIITMTRNLGGMLNRLTWAPLRWARRFYGRSLKTWREETLGLSDPFRPRDGTDPWYGADLRLVGISRHVMPCPSDWDAKTVLTGYWHLPRETDWCPDASLAAFLGKGNAPVYFGFGSMPVEDPHSAARAISEATQAVGCRAVLAAGWAGLGAEGLPSHVHAISTAPHDQLFPLMSGVVHHGGAGTTAAGLLAGRPTLICPAGVDQPFWAARVQKLGCGPSPLPLKSLSASALTKQLEELVTTSSFALNAANVSRKLSKEDGVGTAVSIIEDTMHIHAGDLR